MRSAPSRFWLLTLGASIAVAVAVEVAGCQGDCEPEDDPAFCSRLGVCGQVSGKDNCGADRTVDDCTCASGTCVQGQCCTDTDQDFCSRNGKICGSYTGLDKCGQMRTADCGSCTLPETCQADNTCSCVPDSDGAFCSNHGKNCGSYTDTDNCGQTRTVDSCGDCPPSMTCQADNTCPACLQETDAAFCTRHAKNCGNYTGLDSCGVSRTVDCGACNTSPNLTCSSNVCICTQETNTEFCARNGKNCGNYTGLDNCGLSRTANCGTCAAPPNVTCSSNNVCVCPPETDAAFCTRYGKNCDNYTNTDSCGLSRTANCGTCNTSPNLTCTSNVCVCTPETNTEFCARNGKNCGTYAGTDNCGASRSANCGACNTPPDLTCSSNVCVCTHEPDPAFCSRNGKTCGTYTGDDNCGPGRTADCGLCTIAPNLTCGPNNTCICTPESVAEFCSRNGKDCGTYTGADNCGPGRTADCGLCTTAPNLTCGPSNVCICTAESDAEFCARNVKSCGNFTGTDNCGASRMTNCGTCGAGETCNNGNCVCIAPVCN